MDKAMAKQVLAHASLPQTQFLAVPEWEAAPDVAEKVATMLGWPVFVKPANLGSSIGISRVAGADALADALALAYSHDEWAVVEEAVTAREIECSVLGDREPRASRPGEIRASREFYDYEDKYVADAAELLIPADLPPDVVVEVQHLAIETFTALRLEGMARVDFFYEEEGRGLLVNEANTIPGFTPISMYPKLWEVSGLPYPQLLDELVALALARYRRRTNRWASD
jgi:D-alanine--D-alanine ligase